MTPPHHSLQLEAKINHNVILEDGDQQHDAESREHAKVLQDEVTHLTAFVLLAVTVKHLWQLKMKKRNLIFNNILTPITQNNYIYRKKMHFFLTEKNWYKKLHVTIMVI